MEIKNQPPAGGEANKRQAELLKIKINGFLINYFNYLVFPLAIIILAVGLLVLVYPKYQQIFKVNEANKEVKNNLQVEHEARFNYLNSIRNLQKSYQLINDGDKAKIAAMVPATSDTSLIISEIEAIAARNSVILTSIRIESPNVGVKDNLRVEPKENKESPAGIFNQPPPGVGLVKIEVNLSSVDYSLLKNIIKAFENNLRLFDIAKISFKVSENSAFLNIYSYYLQ